MRLRKSLGSFCLHFSLRQWSVLDDSGICLLVKVHLVYLLLCYVCAAHRMTVSQSFAVIVMLIIMNHIKNNW